MGAQWPNGQCACSQREQSRFEAWPGHCVEFLGKTLNSHSASLRPGVNCVPANCLGNLTNCREVTCDGQASRPGGEEILLSASCYRNWDKLRQLWASLGSKASLMDLDFVSVHTLTKKKNLANIQPYYTTQSVRGPITKINQSKYLTIAGPIFSKYWTGHCPEWSRTCVFAFFSRVINLLYNQACSGPYWENCQDPGPIFSQYGPRAWLIRYMYPE